MCVLLVCVGDFLKSRVFTFKIKPVFQYTKSSITHFLENEPIVVYCLKACNEELHKNNIIYDDIHFYYD